MLVFLTAFIAPFVIAQGVQQIWGGFNITQSAIDIKNSISSPTCNNTQPCITFVNVTIPTCLKLQGDAGCWCSNHDPLHYCVLCMSAPTDNTTTSDQTQVATVSHGNYHRGCAAYSAYLNETATAIPSSSAAVSSAVATPSVVAQSSNSSSSSSLSTGALAGIILGGVVALAIIIAGAFLLYRHMQNKHEAKKDANRVVSYYGGGDMEPKYPPGSPGVGVVYPRSPSSPGPGNVLGVERPNYGATSPPPPFLGYGQQHQQLPPASHSDHGGPVPYPQQNYPGDYDTSMLAGVPPPPPSQGPFKS